MFGVLLASDLGGTVRIVQQAGDIVFKKGGREFRIAKHPVVGMRSQAFSEVEQQDHSLSLFSLQAVKSSIQNELIIKPCSDPANVNIAVIDTGIDVANQTLRGYILVNSGEIDGNGVDDDNNGFVDDYYGANVCSFNGNIVDDNGHGTFMTSMIALNSQGNVKIIPIKAFNSGGYAYQFSVAEAIVYAVNRGANIINCSFGDGYATEALTMAVNYAISNGVIVVAAAGNNSREIAMYPAALSGVIAVSALDGADKLTSFSNYGDYIDVSCIGDDVPSIGIGGISYLLDGTSISTAYLSGALANVEGVVNMAGDEVVAKYASDVTHPLNDQISYPGWDKYTGKGKIEVSFFSSSNDEGATTAISSISDIEVINFLNYPNPVRAGGATEFGFYINNNADVKITVYSLNGRKLWSTETSAIDGGTYNKVAYDLTNEFGFPLANDSYLAVLTSKNGSKEPLKKLIFTVLQ